MVVDESGHVDTAVAGVALHAGELLAELTQLAEPGGGPFLEPGEGARLRRPVPVHAPDGRGVGRECGVKGRQIHDGLGIPREKLDDRTGARYDIRDDPAGLGTLAPLDQRELGLVALQLLVGEKLFQSRPLVEEKLAHRR